MVEEKENPQVVMERILSHKADFPLIVKMESVTRKLFGKSVNAIKIVCQDPNLLSKYSRGLRKIKGVKESFEDDIRYSMRYLIDNNVAPCEWHEMEVEEMKNNLGVQVDKLYLAKSFPQKVVEKTEVPQLKILGFSTICYSPKAVSYTHLTLPTKA